MTSETAGFRRTVRHEFKGWKEYNQLHSKGRYPLPSHYYTGSVGDWVRYTLPRELVPAMKRSSTIRLHQGPPLRFYELRGGYYA